MDYTIIQENSELRAYSRAQLKGIWGEMAFVYLVYFLITLPPVFIFSELSPLYDPSLDTVFTIAVNIVSGPFALGFAGFFLKRIRGEQIALENIFDGFRRFLSSFLAMFLAALFTALWSLLLIVPGIIKALSYSMVFYIMYDNPEMNALEAINKSKHMMKGYKLKLFTLGLSFIGWILLALLTLGIGCLWLYPYIELSLGNFYENLKRNQDKPLTIEEQP